MLYMFGKWEGFGSLALYETPKSLDKKNQKTDNQAVKDFSATQW